jgi:hypothetical protein
LSKPYDRGPKRGAASRHRPRAQQVERRHNPPVPLNADGIPAAMPGAPKPSRIVFVSEESRARYPWLPARVIAGSIWRGPANERVRVDENGIAA